MPRVAPQPLNSLIRVVASRLRFPNMCYPNRVKYLHHQLRDPGHLPACFLPTFAARHPLVLLLFSSKRSQDSLWVNGRFAIEEGGSEGCLSSQKTMSAGAEEKDLSLP